MRQIGGVVFDSLALARDNGEVSGSLAVAQMPRLAEYAPAPGGELNCSLRGGRGEDGRLCLWLTLSGQLRLTCQRCLQALELPLQLESRLLLVPAGAAWPDEELVDDSADAIAASAEQSLASLVEEEILLALPLAPRHESCALPVVDGADGRPPSPFAALVRGK